MANPPNDALAKLNELKVQPDETIAGGFQTYFLFIGALAALRVLLGFVSLPESALFAVNLLLAVLFVAAPILAEFFGANSRWSLKWALVFLITGIVVQVAFAYIAVNSIGILSGVSNAIAQAGLTTWCVGLGALLGMYLRDKNLLIPVSIFGAAYDFYLVIAPAGAPAAGLTRKIIQTAPKVFTSVAAQVPAVTSHATTGKAVVGSYVGPADLVFLAAFFIVIFRFHMNARKTLMIVTPVLALYMILVLMTGIPLPALVPIGACIVIANWKHFNLKRDEWIATAMIALFCAAFLTWGIARQHRAQAQPVAPSPSASSQGSEGSATTPAPTNSNRPTSPNPSASGNKPGPQ